MTAPRTRRGGARLGQVGLALVAYYLVPLLDPHEGAVTWLRITGAVALFGVVVWWITREIVRETRAASAAVRPDRLLLLAVGGLLFFALADLAVARGVPGEFTGLRTKTDALYFALTTLATVGFGDVHADGQVARGLLVVQMAFNLVVLTRAARALSHEVANRTARARPRDVGTSPGRDEADGAVRP